MYYMFVPAISYYDGYTLITLITLVIWEYNSMWLPYVLFNLPISSVWFRMFSISHKWFWYLTLDTSLLSLFKFQMYFTIEKWFLYLFCHVLVCTILLPNRRIWYITFDALGSRSFIPSWSACRWLWSLDFW